MLAETVDVRTPAHRGQHRCSSPTSRFYRPSWSALPATTQPGRSRLLSAGRLPTRFRWPLRRAPGRSFSSALRDHRRGFTRAREIACFELVAGAAPAGAGVEVVLDVRALRRCSFGQILPERRIRRVRSLHWIPLGRLRTGRYGVGCGHDENWSGYCQPARHARCPRTGRAHLSTAQQRARVLKPLQTSSSRGPCRSCLYVQGVLQSAAYPHRPSAGSGCPGRLAGPATLRNSEDWWLAQQRSTVGDRRLAPRRLGSGRLPTRRRRRVGGTRSSFGTQGARTGLREPPCLNPLLFRCLAAGLLTPHVGQKVLEGALRTARPGLHLAAETRLRGVAFTRKPPFTLTYHDPSRGAVERRGPRHGTGLRLHASREPGAEARTSCCDPTLVDGRSGASRAVDAKTVRVVLALPPRRLARVVRHRPPEPRARAARTLTNGLDSTASTTRRRAGRSGAAPSSSSAGSGARRSPSCATRATGEPVARTSTASSSATG